jgi:hypothetical protein
VDEVEAMIAQAARTEARRFLAIGGSMVALLAGAGAAAPAADAVVVQTVPPVAGMRFSHAGQTLRADRLGRVSVNLPSSRLQSGLRVLPTPVSRGVRAGIDRWYPSRNIVTVAFFHRVRLKYIDLQGNSVKPGAVESAVVRGAHGGEYTFKGDAPRWLQVSRVVPKLGGRLQSKSLKYGVQRVLVKGSQVVNAGQQQFRPSKTPELPVQLLLYSARFQTKDAFFGFPTGSAVRLKFPTGRVERHELDEHGSLLLPSLPRSDYEVTVDGPGFSFSRPVRLSRNQEVELEVLSYLDIALALFVGLAFAIGLPLIRRPDLRLSLRRAATSPSSFRWSVSRTGSNRK